MFIWNQENIRWLEEAATYTCYYEKLARHILPYLKNDNTICEIGCGLGHLACALAPYVNHVTAIDISPQAIHKVRGKKAQLNIPNLTPIEADWRRWQPQEQTNIGKFDVVLLSYFNAVKRNWLELLNLANRLIIAVLANGKSGTNLVNNQYNPNYEDNNDRETIFNVIPFLIKEKIPYELIACELEYGQPLHSLSDAYNYIASYYLGEEKEIKAYLEKHLISLDHGYYLPKRKKIGIIIINLEN